jgi:hypothetical protein
MRSNWFFEMIVIADFDVEGVRAMGDKEQSLPSLLVHRLRL